MNLLRPQKMEEVKRVIQVGDIQSLRVLITPYNINVFIDGNTPLMWACRNNNGTPNNALIIEHLLHFQPNLSMRVEGTIHQTILIIAVEYGNVYAVRRLAPLSSSEDRYQAFVHASGLFSGGILQCFHEQLHVDVNVRAFGGVTAVMSAASHNRIENVRYLCEHGANIHLLDDSGNNALTFAAIGWSIDICKYLCARRILLHALPRPVYQNKHVLRQYSRTQVLALMYPGEFRRKITSEDILRNILDILAGPK